MPEMKPCPFCGSNKIGMYEDGIDDYNIECRNPDCNAQPEVWGRTKEEAITAWNTRSDGWVACSERMPEIGKKIDMVWDNEAGSRMAIRGRYCKNKRWWCDGTGFQIAGHYIDIGKVTHWKYIGPLPEVQPTS